MAKKEHLSIRASIIIISIFLCAFIAEIAFYYLKENTFSEISAYLKTKIGFLHQLKFRRDNKIKINSDVSSWKTYKSEDYGFEMKYPGEWEIIQEEKGIKDDDYEFEFWTLLGNKPKINGEIDWGLYIFAYKDESCMDGKNYSKEKCEKGKKSELGNYFFIEEGDLYQIHGKYYSYSFVPVVGGKKNGDDSYEFDKSGNEALLTLVEKSIQTFTLKPQDEFVVKMQQREITEKPKAVTSIRALPRGGIRCPHPERKPRKSKTKGPHMDEDCCPDPDEWPKPGCAYSVADYAIMLAGPPAKKK